MKNPGPRRRRTEARRRRGRILPGTLLLQRDLRHRKRGAETPRVDTAGLNLRRVSTEPHLPPKRVTRPNLSPSPKRQFEAERTGRVEINCSNDGFAPSAPRRSAACPSGPPPKRRSDRTAEAVRNIESKLDEMRNLDTNPARRCHEPKPAPRDRMPSTTTEAAASNTRPPSAEADERKLIRLGEARICRRSRKSPRHRSARVSIAEALDTSRSLPPRPACHRNGRPAIAPRERGISNGCLQRRRSDPSNPRRGSIVPPKRPSGVRQTHHPPKRATRRNHSPRPPKRTWLVDASKTRR